MKIASGGGKEKKHSGVVAINIRNEKLVLAGIKCEPPRGWLASIYGSSAGDDAGDDESAGGDGSTSTSNGIMSGLCVKTPGSSSTSATSPLHEPLSAGGSRSGPRRGRGKA
jgi:hypothetical protein